MGARAALACGTALSLAVGCAWSLAADAIAGPLPVPHLGPDLTADYARLADSAGGSGTALFAAIAAIYFLCLLMSGLRRIRREAARGNDEDFAEEPEQLAGDPR
jgi:hypothetical protein